MVHSNPLSHLLSIASADKNYTLSLFLSAFILPHLQEYSNFITSQLPGITSPLPRCSGTTSISLTEDFDIQAVKLIDF